MRIGTSISWERYALIFDLAKKMNDSGMQFGKTALQKFVYLLQEVYGVNLGYQFDLYTYGPFTSQLLQDLDLVESIGAVKVLPLEPMGYKIIPENYPKIFDKARTFIESHEEEIKKLIQNFGMFQAIELELRATIVYICRELKSEGLDRKRLLKLVKDIKPKFSEDEIFIAMKELQSKEYIRLTWKEEADTSG